MLKLDKREDLKHAIEHLTEIYNNDKEKVQLVNSTISRGYCSQSNDYCDTLHYTLKLVSKSKQC